MENGEASPWNYQYHQSGPNYVGHPHFHEGISKGEAEAVQERINHTDTEDLDSHLMQAERTQGESSHSLLHHNTGTLLLFYQYLIFFSKGWHVLS